MRPSSWGPWQKVLGHGWPRHSKQQVVATGPWPCGPPLSSPPSTLPAPLPLPPHCWRGHGDSLTLLQIGLVQFIRSVCVCVCRRCCASHQVTNKSPGHRVAATGESRAKEPTVSLGWCGMVCHAQNWAPISPALPILPVQSTLQPPFSCSALALALALSCPCPVPVLSVIQVSAVPAPIPN